MRTHIKAVLIFSAILISCACIHGAETIELPFDYFYGRWTQGHFLDGRLYYSEENVDEELNYSYTSNIERLMLTRIKEYIVIGDNDDGLYTPMLSYFRRPTSNWQIGVDSLQYRESDYNLDRLENSWDIRQRSGIVARSNWMNSPAFDITAHNAPFVYSFGPILGPGQIRLENRISLFYRGLDKSVGNIFLPTDYDAYFARLSREYQGYEWRSENYILWGIRAILT